MRRVARQVLVGDVAIGGGAAIVVQSMTNTDTADVAATVAQVAALARAGSELVRVTVNTAEAAAAVPQIRDRLAAMGIAVSGRASVGLDSAISPEAGPAESSGTAGAAPGLTAGWRAYLVRLAQY